MDEAWRGVDEGWGRRAVDFATLSEPGNCREYVAMHHRLGVDRSDRLLDVACGSGLALELATAERSSGCRHRRVRTVGGHRPRQESQRRDRGRRHERAPVG